jgi:hypothetical protein
MRLNIEGYFFMLWKSCLKFGSDGDKQKGINVLVGVVD